MLKAFAVVAAFGLAAASLPAVAAPMTPAEKDYQRSCANVLNFVPRIVRREAVAAIGPDAQVVLHAICRGVPLHESGNASGLGKTIAANATLRRALAKWGWRVDDVISIAIRGNSVDLYVHRN